MIIIHPIIVREAVGQCLKIFALTGSLLLTSADMPLPGSSADYQTAQQRQYEATRLVDPGDPGFEEHKLVGEFAVSFNIPHAAISTYRFVDPDIEGVVFYLTDASSGGPESVVLQEPNPHRTQIRSFLRGPIHIKKPIALGPKRIHWELVSLKDRIDLQYVMRVYDARLNAFVYIVLFGGLVKGTTNNSISEVPLPEDVRPPNAPTVSGEVPVQERIATVEASHNTVSPSAFVDLWRLKDPKIENLYHYYSNATPGTWSNKVYFGVNPHTTSLRTVLVGKPSLKAPLEQGAEIHYQLQSAMNLDAQRLVTFYDGDLNAVIVLNYYGTPFSGYDPHSLSVTKLPDNIKVDSGSKASAIAPFKLVAQLRIGIRTVPPHDWLNVYRIADPQIEGAYVYVTEIRPGSLLSLVRLKAAPPYTSLASLQHGEAKFKGPISLSPEGDTISDRYANLLLQRHVIRRIFDPQTNIVLYLNHLRDPVLFGEVDHGLGILKLPDEVRPPNLPKPPLGLRVQ